MLLDKDVGTHLPTLVVTHVWNTNGCWTPICIPAPAFIYSASHGLNSHIPNHFFINVTLCFPNRKPIHSFALIDTGCTDSCISDCFATHYSLPWQLKPVPVPILAVDDHLIASGLVTQDVVTNLLVDKHSENLKLGVVSVAFALILGLDWLHHHNDFSDPMISLSCCNLSHTNPVSV